MHPNLVFRHDDPVFRKRMIDEIGFASVFLTTPEGPRVAHTPVLYNDDNTLCFHLDGGKALVVMNGPDAYISARWYSSANQVPTWNYVAFEFEGIARRMNTEALPDLVERLSDHHEAKVKKGMPWTIDKMDEKALAALLRGIVGFEMTIEATRETVKLAQHKPKEEVQRLIAGLEEEGASGMAGVMRDFIQ